MFQLAKVIRGLGGKREYRQKRTEGRKPRQMQKYILKKKKSEEKQVSLNSLNVWVLLKE